MKLRYLLQMILLMVFGLQAAAQKPAILQLEEYNQRGKTHKLTKKNAVVDINSIVNIEVNKDSLRLAVGRLAGISSPETEKLFKELEALSKLLQGYTQQLKTLEVALDDYAAQPRDKKNIEDIAAAFMGIAGNAHKILNIIEGTPLESVLEAKLSVPERLSITEQYLSVFEVADLALKNTQKQVDKIMNQQAVVIQMGAWIITDNGTTPVRLEGFGDIAQGERYEVSRSQLSLNEKQIAELRGYQQVFADNAKTLEELNKKAQKPMATLVVKLNTKVDEFKSKIQSFFDDLEAAGKSVADTTRKRIETYITDYQTDLEGFNQKYLLGSEGADAVDLLVGLEADVKLLKLRTEEFVRIDKYLLKNVYPAVSTDTRLEKSFTDAVEALAFIKQAKDAVGNYVSNFKLLLKGREVNANALEFTDEVFKLSFADVPANSQFNLLFTGVRKPGDLVVLKIAARKGAANRPVDLEVHNLRLGNTLPHIGIAVAYAFAQPFKDNPDNSWLGGPSYSMLFKFGARNMFYRNFIDAGLGLNFSAFDFNRDGNPEISAGAAASIFKDYVQGGIGFNFSSNSPYYHVGLRIPIPTSTIGLFKNDRGQENPVPDFTEPK